MNEYANPKQLYNHEQDGERYALLTKYHAAIYWKRQNPAGFKKSYGQSIEAYKKTAECKKAHRLARGK